MTISFHVSTGSRRKIACWLVRISPPLAILWRCSRTSRPRSRLNIRQPMIRVATGANERVQWSATGTLRITTPKLEEQEREALQTFLPGSARYWVTRSPLDRRIGTVVFSKPFTMRINAIVGSHLPGKTFFGGIIGLGCGIGTQKIAHISRQLRPRELEQTVNWFFSPRSHPAGQ